MDIQNQIFTQALGMADTESISAESIGLKINMNQPISKYNH